jgi:hypothetical protein
MAVIWLTPIAATCQPAKLNVNKKKEKIFLFKTVISNGVVF